MGQEGCREWINPPSVPGISHPSAWPQLSITERSPTDDGKRSASSYVCLFRNSAGSIWDENSSACLE